MQNIRYCLLSLFISLFALNLTAANQRPALLVNNQDKKEILQKVESQEWALRIFEGMKLRLSPYVAHYRMTTEYDPTWLISRYVMNREEGKRFTNLKLSNIKNKPDSIWGNAPVPTLVSTVCDSRFEPHNRFNFQFPPIEEILPFNKQEEINILNKQTGLTEKVKLSTVSNVINGEINRLALDAAILYWLTGEKEYGRMAADVFQQWAEAAFYQNPVAGSHDAGLFCSHIGGDLEYMPLLLAYDFLGDFFEENNYNTTYYQPVFEKIANTLMTHGEIDGFADKSPMLVFSSLLVQDKQKKESLLSKIVEKDTIVGKQYGNLSLKTISKDYITTDGYFKDPGKHASAIYNLLLSVWTLEKNNYPVLNTYTNLGKSGEVRMKTAFPNLALPAFGDISNPYPDGQLLELAIALDLMKNRGEAVEMCGLLNLMIREGAHKRSDNSWLGLLLYTDIPTSDPLPDNFWKRSGQIDYAHYYYQRNGFDRNNGMMVGVQGATYSGNHANGMSADFYGAGRVMGADPGIGRNLNDTMHIKYYSQWAAHNTVIAAGSSSPEKIYKGGGTAKAIGQIELTAMEPMPDSAAVSPDCSFMNTHYLEPYTRTNEDRMLSLIRVSPTAGFYVDIFRSANKLWNDYLYHNIGDNQELFSDKKETLVLAPEKIPTVEPDFPGMRFIEKTKSTGEFKEGVVSLFTVEQGAKNRTSYMQVLMPGAPNRSYFTGLSPRSESSLHPYDSIPLPTLVVHQKGDAWDVPFVAVYEPFIGKENNVVESVNWLNQNYRGLQTALEVKCKNDLKYWVMQSVERSRRGLVPGGAFTGIYATVSFVRDTLQSVYFGKAYQFSCKGFSVKADNSECSANITFGKNYLDITSNQELDIKWDAVHAKNVYLLVKGSDEHKEIKRAGRRNTYTIPPVKEGRVIFEE
jgi:Heparinase II/III-like protein.